MSLIKGNQRRAGTNFSKYPSSTSDKKPSRFPSAALKSMRNCSSSRLATPSLRSSSRLNFGQETIQIPIRSAEEHAQLLFVQIGNALAEELIKAQLPILVCIPSLEEIGFGDLGDLGGL